MQKVVHVEGHVESHVEGSSTDEGAAEAKLKTRKRKGGSKDEQIAVAEGKGVSEGEACRGVSRVMSNVMSRPSLYTLAYEYLKLAADLSVPLRCVVSK